MVKKNNINDFLKSLFFLLYFVILTSERTVSLVTSFSTGSAFSDALNIYMTLLTVLSIIVGWGLLIKKGRGIFKLTESKEGKDFLFPSVAAGTLLFGGMVHTEGSIPPLQFASYGFLLGAMALYTWQCVKAEGKGLLRWLTFAYITAFSMAIPVVYANNCDIPDCMLCGFFYPAEIIVSAGLVELFTVLLYSFFKKKGVISFGGWNKVLLITAVGDALVLGLRWHSEINFFVLFALAAAVVVWVIYLAVGGYKEKKEK